MNYQLQKLLSIQSSNNNQKSYPQMDIIRGKKIIDNVRLFSIK